MPLASASFQRSSRSRCGVLLLLLRGHWVAVGSGYPAWRLYVSSQLRWDGVNMRLTLSMLMSELGRATEVSSRLDSEIVMHKHDANMMHTHNYSSLSESLSESSGPVRRHRSYRSQAAWFCRVA